MHLFEEARWAMLESVGFSKKKVEESGFGPVLVEAHLYYKRELEAETQLEIETQIMDGERRLFKITQWLRDDAGTVCAEADFKLGYFDLKTRRLISPPPEWASAFGKLGSKTP
jgi:acyl-CoA thioester hydrolase